MRVRPPVAKRPSWAPRWASEARGKHPAAAKAEAVARNSRRFILNLSRVPVLLAALASVFAPVAVAENVQMKKRRHQEVRHIHQLIDVEVNRRTGQHVGLLARQPASS